MHRVARAHHRSQSGAAERKPETVKQGEQSGGVPGQLNFPASQLLFSQLGGNEHRGDHGAGRFDSKQSWTKAHQAGTF